VSAPGTGTAGTAIAATAVTATLAGTASGTGTITFTVFGPTSPSSPPADCTTGGTTVGTAAVSGDNTYNPSAGFTPGSAGTYWWYASYGGDGTNAASNSGCGTGMTSTTVIPLYGFGGFMAPVPKSTLTYKAGSAIPVKFTLTDASGQPIPAATAAALAAGKQVEATLSGPGASTTVLTHAFCSWNSTYLFFQCNLKTPSGLKTGKANPYQITVSENLGGGFVPAPGTANPETIYFK
jgi:hypothetical protein